MEPIGSDAGDHVYLDFVRDGLIGDGIKRAGDPRWRRVSERRVRAAKSVFHFDVQGQVAKSTHAGLPWLLCLRRHLKDRIHIWPFDRLPKPHRRDACAPQTFTSGPRGDAKQPDRSACRH